MDTARRLTRHDDQDVTFSSVPAVSRRQGSFGIKTVARKSHNLIDETIHQRTRLAIMATLAGVESLTFRELQAELGLSDGNLSSHAAALERAGYVRISKAFAGRKPRTTLAIAPRGKRALRNYVDLLQGILAKAK